MLEPDGYLAAPVAAFLDAVASVEPTPGGGAVAAITVAMAAALVVMAAAFSGDADLDEASIASEARRLAGSAAELATADAESYTALLRARGRPKDDPGRAGLIEAALAGASEIPLEITATARRVNELACDLARSGNRNLRGDAASAAYLAAAAAWSAAALVAINLTDPEDARVREAADLAEGCELPTREELQAGLAGRG